MTTVPPVSPDEFHFGDRLPLLPIRNALLFPTAVAPFEVGRPKSVRLIQELEKATDPVVAIFAQRDPRTDDPRQEELYPYGAAARLLKVIRHSSGASMSVILQGGVRIRLDEIVQREPFLTARVTRLADVFTTDVELEALLAPEVREAIAQAGVRLVSYREL